MINRKNLLIFLLPLLAVSLLYMLGSNMLSDVNRTWLQILIYPLVLLSLAHVSAQSFRIPRIILFASAVFALTAVAYANMYPLKAHRGGLVVARLEGDELQNETRIFREKINQALDDTKSIRALSINEGFSKLEDAEEFIADNKKLKILITGDRRWINIFFPERAASSLRDLGLSLKLPVLANLKMHFAVRTLGLSLHPSHETSLFIANLSEGVINYKDRAKNNSFEISLLNATKIEAFWTSNSHKAYPAWFLANYYVEKSIEGAKLNRFILECAINSYKRGFSLLRKGDNPDLRASILNNLGVAYALRGYMTGNKKDVKVSRRYMEWAIRVYREKSKLQMNFSAAEVANDNLVNLLIAKPRFKQEKIKKKKGKKLKVKKEKPAEKGERKRRKRKK